MRIFVIKHANMHYSARLLLVINLPFRTLVWVSLQCIYHERKEKLPRSLLLLASLLQRHEVLELRQPRLAENFLREPLRALARAEAHGERFVRRQLESPGEAFGELFGRRCVEACVSVSVS